MSIEVNATEQIIEVNATGSTIDINVNSQTVDVNATTSVIDVEVSNGVGPAGPGVPTGGTTGQVLKKLSNSDYDTYWALDGGGVPYTGATGDVDLGEYELKAGQVEFDQSPTGTAGVGVLRWNNTDGTLDLGLKGGSVTLQVGEDIVARVVNKTGGNLLASNYQVVRVSSAQGQRLAVTLAQGNNDNNSADTLGLVIENINNNQEGWIQILGQLTEVNTTGSLQGETWTDGDVLYLSPTTAGALTNVKPVAPQHIVVLGYVEYAHSQHGKIYVKVMNGWELGELHDVDTTGATDGQVLSYNAALGIWKPVTNAAGNIYTTDGTLTGNRTVTMGSYTLSFEKDILVNGLTIGTGTLNVFTNTAVGYQSLYSINNAALSSNTGIGYRALYLHQSGQSNTAIGTNSLRNSTSGTLNTAAGVSAGLSLTTGTANSIYGVNALNNLSTGSYNIGIGNQSGLGITTGSNNTIIGSRVTGLSSTLSNNIILADGSGNIRIRAFDTGNVTIGGTVDAGYTFDVQGTTRIKSTATSDAGQFVITDQTTSNNLFRFTGNGKLFIGTASFPSVIQSAGTSNNLLAAYNYLDGATDNTGTIGAFNVGSLGSISNMSLSATYYNNLYLKSTITTSYNSAVINEAVIGTVINGTSTGVMRGLFINPTITSGGTGWLAIQSTSGGAYFNTSSVAASAILQADSTTKGFLQPRMTETQRDAIVSPATGLSIYNTTTNTNDYYNGTAWVSTQSAITNPITGTGASGQVAYWSGTNTQTGSATFTFSPTAQLLLNNSVTAATAIARGANFTPTLVAAANNDVLVGLDVTSTFTRGAFTGVASIPLRITNSDFISNVTGTTFGVQINASQTASFGITGAQKYGLQIVGSGNFNRNVGTEVYGLHIPAYSGTVYNNYYGGAYISDRVSIGTFNSIIQLGADASPLLSIGNNTNYSSYQNNPNSIHLRLNSNTNDLTAGIYASQNINNVQAGIFFTRGNGNGVGVIDFITANSNVTGTLNARMFGTGNLLLQNGGTFTDGGQRLQVQGDAFIKGSGNTSGTNALIVQNSTSSSNIFQVRNDGYLISNAQFVLYGRLDIDDGFRSIFAGSARTSTSRTNTGTSTIFYNAIQLIGGSAAWSFYSDQNYNATSGALNGIFVRNSFAPTSGTATFSNEILTVINQTGGANGITRGLYVNPTLTAAADWRSIEWSNNSGWGLYGAGSVKNYLNGNTIIGGSATDGGQKLQVNGTTQMTPAADASALTISGYSVTGSGATNGISLTGTWNTTGNPSAIFVNITNTASNIGSRLIDLRFNNVTAFRVSSNPHGLSIPVAIGSSGLGVGTISGIYAVDNTQALSSTGDAMNFSDANTSSGYSYYFASRQYTNKTYTSGIGGLMIIDKNFTPTSGTGVFTTLTLQNTINQTGGANGITRGLYVNPTLTAAADWRSIETSNNSGWAAYFAGSADLFFGDGTDVQVGATNGTKIGTATSQKIGFWNATPIVQPTTAVASATFTANTGTAVNDASTFDGYTMAQVVKALRNAGLLA